MNIGAMDNEHTFDDHRKYLRFYFKAAEFFPEKRKRLRAIRQAQ